MRKTFIAGIMTAGLIAVQPFCAAGESGNMRVTIGAEDAAAYDVREETGAEWDMTYQGLMTEEALDICRQTEKAGYPAKGRNVRVDAYLKRDSLKTDSDVWNCLTRISHDVLSYMLYERPDLYGLRPETFTWIVPYGGNDEAGTVKSSLDISFRKADTEKEGTEAVFDENLDATVSDILENSDYNMDGKTDEEELARGVYETTRRILSPDTGKDPDTEHYGAVRAFVPEYGNTGTALDYSLTVKALCNRTGIECMTVLTHNGNETGYADAVRMGGNTYLMDVYTDDLNEKKTVPSGFLSYRRPDIPSNTFFGYQAEIRIKPDENVTPAGFSSSEVTITEEPFSYDYTHHHAYSEVFVEPTCTSDGYIEGTCICGDKMRYGFVKAAGHSFAVTEEKKATCTEKGYTKSRCGICGEEEVEIVPALGHDNVKTVTEPDCTQPGRETVACRRCGRVLSDTEIEPLGHDFSGEATEKGATCLSSGYIERKCRRCGETEREETSGPTEHEFRAEEVVAPTCTSDGYTFYQCRRCGKIEKGDVVPATGHSYDTETVEATCTQDGYTRHRCENCGDIYDTDPVPAYGHDWENVETVDSTGTEEGHILKRCSRCGEEKTTVIPMKEPQT